MKLKVFTLLLDAKSGEFDDRAMEQFLAERVVMSVWEHFVVIDGHPVWSVMVGYKEGEPFTGRLQKRDGVVDYRSTLSAAERQLYDGIRRWRNEAANRQGKPPYVLLTNQQVVEIVKRRPQTKQALGEVKGVGASRVESIGEELLTLLDTLYRSEEAGTGGQDGT